MKVLMLDTKQELDLDEAEAVNRICAGMAVEVFLETKQNPALESAMLDRQLNTMTKPSPQQRPAPQREKRGKRRQRS